MDLGKLLDMARELAWFRPGGVPGVLTEMLARYVHPESLAALTDLFKDSPSAGHTSADLLRQYRNLLHPAYCLKQDIHPQRTLASEIPARRQHGQKADTGKMKESAAQPADCA
jgi:hypothetical protein